MIRTPIDARIVREHIVASGLESVGQASIRELNRLVLDIEKSSDVRFIRMEMGIPGLPPPRLGIEAEIEALKRGVGSKYPPFDGIPQLKAEISRFVLNFLDVKIDAAHCMPTVGSMQGCYMGLMVASRRVSGRDGILFIDPGFPVNKTQTKVIGIESESFDIYDCRGERLRERLESFLEKGRFAAVMYSNPNNPSWICLTERELKIVGELCTKYDVVALEDLAYFGMDFRQDYSQPGVAPFVPTVAKYTDNCILLISSSKSFSMAGQRIGMMALPDALFLSRSENLRKYFATDRFGHALGFGAMYAVSSGVSHSAQYGLTAVLRAANEGSYDFVDSVREYEYRAKEMKRIFAENGFLLVYDRDEDRAIADGFYFTLSYPGFGGADLVEELLYYGISAISLSTTGSTREGIRACVSLTGRERFPELEERLKQFHKNQKRGLRAIQRPGL